MRESAIEQAIQVAVGQYQAGRMNEAEAICRQILAAQPDNANALHLLGVLIGQSGRIEEAENLIRQAIVAAPGNPVFYCSLGTFQEKRGEPDQAIASFQEALAIKPDYAQGHHSLGMAWRKKGQIERAIAFFQRALELKPDFAEAHNNLGNALARQGELEQAIACYRRALALKPNLIEAFNNLGNRLRETGRFDEAISNYRQAIALNPGYVDAQNNLGNAWKEKGEIDQAIACYQRALAIKPDDVTAYTNLGAAYPATGQYALAIACYEKAMALDPSDVAAHCNLVYLYNFHPDYGPGQILAAARRFNDQRAEPLKRFIQPHDNDPKENRRLRIGYVSPDFREQSESFFTVPLLANHDHAEFEILCYSSVLKPDGITARLRDCADVWRQVRNESDEALAQIIRADRIDILVDLTMHMSGSRALLFAQKPAPVQVCWLAYPGTTGLSTMDYRITDAFMDPADSDTSCYSEESIRLPHSWVVYDPLVDVPARPPEQNGPITFGSLNNPGKLNEPVLSLWGRLLQVVPMSRLLMQVFSLEHRQRIRQLMESQGIAQSRLEFVGRMDRTTFLRTHDRIDIALDPLPYNGITTTCDALFMGTPVLTLVGQTAAGRAGKGMLSTIGLNELIADNSEEFVRKGTELAGDIPRLVEIRRTLRRRLRESPLMNAKRFTRDMENAYRATWRTWCRKS
jgi:protein O-GlcNAc transferase